MPEKYLDCLIPKITLQPIVENSILHGILEKEDESGAIKICIEEDENDLIIIIEDDGVGMTADKISSLFVDFNENDLHGYGIKNINDRLALHFGAKYGLTYESQYGKGTTVRVRIPKSGSI
ncbi:MAG: sensor histidine kinase [Bacteroidota bacterium]